MIELYVKQACVDKQEITKKWRSQKLQNVIDCCGKIMHNYTDENLVWLKKKKLHKHKMGDQH
jgi:uncharacterized protein (DUF927 family)